MTATRRPSQDRRTAAHRRYLYPSIRVRTVAYLSWIEKASPVEIVLMSFVRAVSAGREARAHMAVTWPLHGRYMAL